MHEYARLLCGVAHIQAGAAMDSASKHALLNTSTDLAGQLLLVHAGCSASANVRLLDAVPNMYLHHLRWWEARKMWGQLLNITRNLVRQVRL